MVSATVFEWRNNTIYPRLICIVDDGITIMGSKTLFAHLSRHSPPNELCEKRLRLLRICHGRCKVVRNPISGCFAAIFDIKFLWSGAAVAPASGGLYKPYPWSIGIASLISTSFTLPLFLGFKIQVSGLFHLSSTTLLIYFNASVHWFGLCI